MAIKRKSTTVDVLEPQASDSSTRADSADVVQKKAKTSATTGRPAASESSKGKSTAWPQPDESLQTHPPVIYKNKTMPENYVLPAKVGDVKICCWNVTSVKSASDPKHAGSGLLGYMTKEDADILILTETKRNNMGAIPEDKAFKALYPFQYWANSSQKGYAGTCILSKIEPINSILDIKVAGETVTGRMVTLEFPTIFLIGTYVPNASAGLKNMSQKEAWNKAFEAKLRELDAIKPVIWGGDLNVVASGNDLTNAKTNWNKTAGFTQKELDGFHSQLNPSKESGHKPLFDAWRHLHGPNEIQYTYHSKRVGQREKGHGWRLDSFIVSERLLPRVKACEIRREQFGPSDHLPVVIELSGKL